MSFFVAFMSKDINKYRDYQEKAYSLAKAECAKYTSLIDHNNGVMILVGSEKFESERFEDTLSVTGNQNLFIVGKIYSHDYKMVNREFQESILNTIIADNDEKISKLVWGKYLIIYYDKLTNTLKVYRDPQGLNSAFYFQNKDSVFLSSKQSYLLSLTNINFNYNWDYILKFLKYSDLISRDTVYDGVKEIKKGSFIKITCQDLLRLSENEYWKFPQQKNFYNNTNFENQLLSTLKDIFACLITPYKKVCLKLSGGIDSSALLAIYSHYFKSFNTEFYAITHTHTKFNEFNEINYARNIAKDCNVILLETNESHFSYFERPIKKIKWDKPFVKIINQNFFSSLLSQGLSDNQTVFMDGQGGDHLFSSSSPLNFLCDSFLSGNLIYLFKKSYEYSILTKLPLFHVMQKALLRALKFKFEKKIYVDSYPNNITWINDKFENYFKNLEIDNEDIYFDSQVLPGKFEHNYTISFSESLANHNLNLNDEYSLRPFISQPIIELVSQVPTPELYNKDYDRIIIRNAMRNISSSENFHRKTKGGGNSYIDFSIRQNFNRITELCMEGFLARHRIISKDNLHSTLIQILNNKSNTDNHILNLIAFEMWFENWV